MNFHSAVNNKNTRNIKIIKPNKLVTRTNLGLLRQHNIASQNWGNEFKKLIKKLAGSKSRKIKKLAAWKKFEFLIKKTACIPADIWYVRMEIGNFEILVK